MDFSPALDVPIQTSSRRQVALWLENEFDATAVSCGAAPNPDSHTEFVKRQSQNAYPDWEWPRKRANAFLRPGSTTPLAASYWPTSLSLLLGLVLWASGLSLSIGAGTDASPLSLTNLADLPLEQLPQIPIETVSGASRYEQKVTEAPASVSIVTADEIKKQGYRTLAGVLASVPGFYVTDDRNYSYLGVRGFNRPGDYNSRVLLLVDGHRLNDNIFDQALLGTEGVVDVDLIDHVEVIRGPASSLYGDNAFFGIVNVTTKRGADINGVESSVAAGDDNTYKGRFTYGQKWTNDVEVLVSGSWYESGGTRQLYYPEFDNPTNHYGIAQDADGDRSQSLFSKLMWKDFTLSGAFSDRQKQVPTASFGTVFNSGREQTTDLRSYLDLKFEHEFPQDTRLLGRVYYDLYSYEGDYPYYARGFPATLNPAPLVINDDDALGQWVGTEWQLTQKLFDRHTLVVGLDYRENLEQSQHSYYQLNGYPDIRVDHTGRDIGLYGQAELNLLTNLTFNGGLRYDHYDTFGGTLNPRLGLIYNPWQKSYLKLLYGQAYRAPNVFELYYADPGANRANPYLTPETIRSYDLIYEQYLPANFRFSASGFYYQIRDLISQQQDALGETYFANVDRANSKGVELELEHKSAGGLLARVSYTRQQSENPTTGEELSNSPKNLAKLGLIVPVYEDKVFTGLEVLYTDSVRTLAGNRADGFGIVNLTLFSQKLVKGLEASATVYNLLDARYGYPGSADHRQDIIPGQGRSFRVKLTYRF